MHTVFHISSYTLCVLCMYGKYHWIDVCFSMFFSLCPFHIVFGTTSNCGISTNTPYKMEKTHLHVLCISKKFEFQFDIKKNIVFSLLSIIYHYHTFTNVTTIHLTFEVFRAAIHFSTNMQFIILEQIVFVVFCRCFDVE